MRLIINDESVELSFVRDIDDLIFYKNKFTDLERLYILNLLIKNTLEIIYNNDYLDFERTFDIVFKLKYIKNLLKHLYDYMLWS